MYQSGRILVMAACKALPNLLLTMHVQAASTCRRGGAKAAAYIKISEAEIADDYPEPTQYEKACPCPSRSKLEEIRPSSHSAVASVSKREELMHRLA